MGKGENLPSFAKVNQVLLFDVCLFFDLTILGTSK